VLFGGSTGDGETIARRAGSSSPLARYGARLLLVLAVGLLFFGRLSAPLLEPEEAMYAEIPREMGAAGNWLVPMHQGRAFYEKPPMLYWLILVAYSIFGVHEWSARLVAAAAALGTVLVTFWWGQRALGLRAGLAGALILCLSPRFIHQARLITMDGLLCLWVVTGLALGQAALQSGRLVWRWWLLSAAACGLGLLTKGPVALLLVAVPLLGYQLLDLRTARPRGRSWLAYLAAAVGLALPWYAALAWRDPSFVYQFFWNHHVALRFVQPLHVEPAWFYLPILLLGMLPGTVLLPSLVRHLARRSRPAARRRPSVLGFWLLSGAWCVLFFSVADCKRIGYILPAMPPLALALGYTLDRRLPVRGKTSRVCCRKGRGTLLPLGATLGVLAVGLGGALWAGHAGLIKPAPALALVCLTAAGISWSIYRRRQTSIAAWMTCGVATFVVMFLAVQWFLPSYYRRFSMRAQVQSLQDHSGAVPLPIVCYPHSWDSIHFYLKRDEVRSFGRNELDQLLADLERRSTTLVLVKTGTALAELLDNLPPSLEFVPQSQSRTVTVGLVRTRTGAAPVSLN
jgi:4-amino-4-deoxy-L-arabinose transferase-like glycosyltransferase